VVAKASTDVAQEDEAEKLMVEGFSKNFIDYEVRQPILLGKVLMELNF